jgi:hypothetical protein
MDHEAKPTDKYYKAIAAEVATELFGRGSRLRHLFDLLLKNALQGKAASPKETTELLLKGVVPKRKLSGGG